MDSENENKAGRPAATKVGGRRVSAPDHPVPVVRKEYERKDSKDYDPDANSDTNWEEREIEKIERFEYEKLSRLAAGERLSHIQANQPKQQKTNNFRQKENIFVNQPILHNHEKSGSAAQK
ncbi:hypothetical protein FBU30_006765 [Linnemannia zychae]|nr:hypothetical protein FBU30_006765 [Linnemannia zychae]